jgi:hypothetical protein
MRHVTDRTLTGVHESNGKSKRRLTDFVFTRQVEPLEEPTSSPTTEHEQIRRIKPLPRSASSQLPGPQPPSRRQAQEATALGATENMKAGQTANNILQSSSQNAAPITPQSEKQQPRRFHLSRSASMIPSTPAGLSEGTQKRTTLFVERRGRARVSPTGSSSSPFTPALNPELEQAPASEKAPALKKPGKAARTSAATPAFRAPQLAAQPRDVRLPSGLLAPWSLDDQQLVEEMQRYTLQEIGYSIAEAEATKPGDSPAPTSVKKPSRFKPKVPKLRYHERHPEKFTNQDSQMEVEEFVEDMDDDSDYIIDTYIRVPADVMELDTNAETNFGFLVLDGQDDIDEFYNAEIESDEDEGYDDEDENAENHYSADYPDEEVESDDEYGRNPYQYANNDDDDAAFSDDSEEGIEGVKYPWTKKPAWLRKAEHGSDDEDEGH